MPPETVQIGPLIISKALFDVIVPLISGLVGTLTGGLITFLVTNTIENRKWRRETEYKFKEEKREALAIALEWIAPLQQSLTKASLVSSGYQSGRIDQEQFIEKYPDIISSLTKLDPAARLRAVLAKDAYALSFEIIDGLDRLKHLSLQGIGTFEACANLESELREKVRRQRITSKTSTLTHSSSWRLNGTSSDRKQESGPTAQLRSKEDSMLRSILGFDWRKSPAHLLFLSKFLKPRAMDDFTQSDTWKVALKEAPKKTMRRFLDEGLLEQASLNRLLGYKYKVSELKSMLKQRGLPVSGSKAELIEGLVQADPEGMRKATRGLSVLQCSEKGRTIAEEYLAQEKETRAKVEEQTLQALRQRRFKEASQVVAAFEAQQVFPRGIGIDWKHHNPAHDVAMLKVIFQAKPKILNSLNDEQMRHLRFAAGMMHLWGTNQAKSWLPDGFETGLIMDNDTATRMVLFHASHQRSIAQYRAAGVRKVEILATDNSCVACKKLAKKKYKINEVPELPYEKCTSEMGCRCTTVVADF